MKTATGAMVTPQGIVAFSVVVLISATMLMGVMMVVVAGVNAETGTRLADADEAHSGAADDAAEYQTNPSVSFSAGEYITEEVDDFNDGIIEVYIDSQATNQELRIKVEDEDNSDDYFHVDITTVDADTTTVDFHDHFSGSSESESESKTFDTYNNANAAWTKVKIEISDTSDSTDGSRKKIAVDIDGTNFIEQDMISPEISMDIKTRQWNQVKFRASSANSGEYNVDDWDIDTSEEGSAYTWTLWIIIILVLYLLISLLFLGTWPFNGSFWNPLTRGSGKFM